MTIFDNDSDFGENLLDSIKKQRSRKQTPNKRVAGSSSLVKGHLSTRGRLKKVASHKSITMLNRSPSAQSYKSNKSIRSGRSGKSGRSGRSSRNRITYQSDHSYESSKERPGRFDQFKSGALNVLRKITNAKQIKLPDPRQFENLGGNVSKAQMINKMQRIWKQLDQF